MRALPIFGLYAAAPAERRGLNLPTIEALTCRALVGTWQTHTQANTGFKTLVLQVGYK
jgi:hypothetical protein